VRVRIGHGLPGLGWPATASGGRAWRATCVLGRAGGPLRPGPELVGFSPGRGVARAVARDIRSTGAVARGADARPGSCGVVVAIWHDGRL